MRWSGKMSGSGNTLRNFPGKNTKQHPRHQAKNDFETADAVRYVFRLVKPAMRAKITVDIRP
jgi:hypothetical protein